MATFWYVRAQHRESNRVVERLSIAGGATSQSAAAVDMQAFLLTTAGIDGWEVVETTSWTDGGPLPLFWRPDPSPARPARPLQGWRYDPLLDY